MEGVSLDILDNACGHFPESATENGNVCIAGHNRGYKFNPFGNLKKLKLNDVIYYKKGKNVYKYKVIQKKKIDEENYQEIDKKGDYITIITCVENQPRKRLCVVAKK